jgi:hypothetical protein
MKTIGPTILATGTAVPSLRLKQEETFELCGYKSERSRKIFLNSDIDYCPGLGNLDTEVGNLNYPGVI